MLHCIESTCNYTWLLPMTVARRYSIFSLNKCLFHVSVSLLCVFYLLTLMLFLCLGFVLFGWLSSVYVVFPACTISCHLFNRFDTSVCNRFDHIVCIRLSMVKSMTSPFTPSIFGDISLIINVKYIWKPRRNMIEIMLKRR